MKHKLLGILKGLVLVCLLHCTVVAKATWKELNNGIEINGLKDKLSVMFVNDDVVRVRYVPEGEFVENETNILVDSRPLKVNVRCRENEEHIMMQSDKLIVKISKRSGAVSFYDNEGRLLLSENKTLPRSAEKVEIRNVVYDDTNSVIEKTANGDVKVSNIVSEQSIGNAWKAKVNYEWQEGEALYGLGSHQEPNYNLRGTMQYLYQHNLKATVPVLMSSLGYGLLFNVGSTMEFHDDKDGSYMQMNAVNSVDYIFMYGPEFDMIVDEYRTLTGKVPMLPRYMLGYVQSKERYANPHDIDSVLTRFRQMQIPIDVIVQDWNYWNPSWWGHKRFYEATYPNADKMIQGVHDKNAKFMLSIWPTANGDEAELMDPLGYTLGRGIYDAYQSEARKMYWDELVNKNLFSLGVDAWWCDGTEPIDGDWNYQSNSIGNNPQTRCEKNTRELNNLLGELRANTFSLYHSQGIYENQRATTSQKRVVNLTRSSYAGQQRYATIVWNGDTKATWSDFKAWIPAGMNFFVTGCPYWTIDAGAFFVKNRGQWFWAGDYEQGTADMGFREFYVRNLQFSQWMPLFRSHGCDFAREPWQFGKSGEPFYESIMTQIYLRYRLLPYNYSLMAMVTNNNYTMTRPLMFDFRNDDNVKNIADQFMFGPAFMACPVTEPMYYGANSEEIHGVEKSRPVYLPGKGKWYDFWTGEEYKAGQSIKADAPIDYIPIFVRGGSIVPMGPVKQYSWEESDEPLEIRIYRGADAKFVLYEDEGDNYNYEQGAYATIEFAWDDKNATLTIGGSHGSYDGMEKTRYFNIVIVSPSNGIGIEKGKGKHVYYEGKEIKIKQ